MRMGFLPTLVAVAWLGLAGPAAAGVTVNAKTTTYGISGRTGHDLLEQMDRKGPKHGFLTRAIAQTRYTVKWEISWKQQGRKCRVDKVDARLDVTYRYPQVTSPMAPALKRRWNSFMRGVKKHEEVHGTLAARMVRDAEKSIRNLEKKNDPKCRSARSEVKKRVDAVYARYEARQTAFDEREHRDGGAVALLVERLVR